MTQRNPMNDRYTTEEKRSGKTRRSSASAKPKAQRAATLRDPAPKTKKQKKEEARERERKESQKLNAVESAFESTERYKKLRRIWWALLGAAIACTALSFVFQTNEALKGFSMVVMILAYVFIIGAFYIDLGKIRKERKKYAATIAASKTKEARRDQKRVKAEMRAQQKEAEEKYEAAKAEEEAKKAAKAEKGLSGLFGRFRKSDTASSDGPEIDKKPDREMDGAEIK